MPVIPNRKAPPPSNPLPQSLRAHPKRLAALFAMCEPCPASWFEGNGKAHGSHPRKASSGGGGDLEPIPCTDYGEVISAWGGAMRLRASMDDALSVALSVCISTEQVGDQLFLKMIGDAGSGKTRFCEGLLVSRSCYPLEHLTGFHSGWKGEGNGKDYSLLSRINRMTLITPEGDVLVSSPQFQQIMSQQRRIFDGTSGADYKNMEEQQRHTGLRTPWIIAGTPALLDADQSRLGDRFIKVYIDPPESEEEKRHILMMVARSAFSAVKLKSEEHNAEKQMTPEMAYAYQITGGYVDWLKANTNLINRMDMADQYLERCTVLAEFTASMRASQPKEHHATVELPTRLTHQMVRLACCNAVVLNKAEVDAEVMRRIRKVAIDTSRGPNLDVVRILSNAPYGAELKVMTNSIHITDDRCRSLMRFLSHIGVVTLYKGQLPAGIKSQNTRWRLTDSMKRLYHEVQP